MGLYITTAESNNRGRQKRMPVAFLFEVWPVIERAKVTRKVPIKE